MTMSSSKYISPAWIGVTAILSVLFAILFFPVVTTRYGIPTAVILTVIGVGVIWLNYFIRARIFSRWSERKREESEGSSG